MKRFFALLLVLCLALPFCAAHAAEVNSTDEDLTVSETFDRLEQLDGVNEEVRNAMEVLRDAALQTSQVAAEEVRKAAEVVGAWLKEQPAAISQKAQELLQSDAVQNALQSLQDEVWPAITNALEAAGVAIGQAASAAAEAAGAAFDEARGAVGEAFSEAGDAISGLFSELFG